MLKWKRGQVHWNELIPWIIGIAVLVIMLVIGGILISKGSGAGEYIRNLFRFGN